MATKDWKSLEGKPWRLDVGSTQKEALSATNPAILHVTTEQSMVMNGEVVARGKPDISAEGARAAIALYAAAGDKKLFGPNNILYTNNNTLGGTIGKAIYDSSTPTEYKKGSPFEVFCTQGIMSGVHSEKYMIWFGLRKSATNIERYSCQQVIGQTEEEFYKYGTPVAFRLNDGKVYTPFKGSSGLSIGTSKEYILSRECVIPSYSDLHDAATSEKDGLMSAQDKTKLNNLTAYARDLGNFESEEAALDALKDIEISSNSNIVHVHCTYANGAMSITMMQSIENDYCRQIIFNKSKLYQRAIYFTSGERTEISYAEDWSFLSGDRLSWDSENNKYSLCAFDTAFNQAYCDPIPTATANNDGLMSAADKQKLDNVPTNTKAKLKKLSNPDFKVVVRKAIPLHPRKGMKYFFDNDIRFSIPRKYIVDEGNTITVPNDGKTYYTIPSTIPGSQNIIPNGTIINNDNYDTYFQVWVYRAVSGSQVLCCKTSMPALVTIKKEGFSLEANTIRVSNLSEQLCFDTYSLYRKVEANKVVFDIPLPSVRVGDTINNVPYLQFFKEKRKTFGVFNEERKIDFIMDKGKKYYGKRICKIKDIKVLKTKHGVFYVSKTIVNKRKRWSNRFSNYKNYGPKLKIIIENGVIKKRM